MAEVHYLISDASKKVDVESHVLRYWEDELELDIPRNDMGHRYYTEYHIRLFRQIKELKEKGYQLKAIKNALNKMAGVMEKITITEDYMEEDMKAAWDESHVREAGSVWVSEPLEEAQMSCGSELHKAGQASQPGESPKSAQAAGFRELGKGAQTAGSQELGRGGQPARPHELGKGVQAAGPRELGKGSPAAGSRELGKGPQTSGPRELGKGSPAAGSREPGKGVQTAGSQELGRGGQPARSRGLPRGEQAAQAQERPEGAQALRFGEAEKSGQAVVAGELQRKEQTVQAQGAQGGKPGDPVKEQSVQVKESRKESSNMSEDSRKEQLKARLAEQSRVRVVDGGTMPAEMVQRNLRRQPEPGQREPLELNAEKMARFQSVMNHIIGRAMDANMDRLAREVSNTVSEDVTDKVMKEVEYLMRVSDEKEEERFRQLDETIRAYQKQGKGRAEAAATKIPFFKKKRFGKSGKKMF